MTRPAESSARYVIGLDLARSASGDFSAIVVDEISGDRASRRHAIRWLERNRGVPFPEQVERIRNLLEALGGSSRALAFDATGAGLAVADYLRRAELPARLIAVTITGGLEAHSDNTGGRRIPKADLLAALALAVETRRLQIAARLRLAEALMRELEDYRQTLTASGRSSLRPPEANMTIWSSRPASPCMSPKR